MKESRGKPPYPAKCFAWHLAGGETVTLLHPPLPSARVNRVEEEGFSKMTGHADGCWHHGWVAGSLMYVDALC